MSRKILHGGKTIDLDKFMGKDRLLENEHERRIYASAFDLTLKTSDRPIDIDAADHNGLLAVRRYRERAGTV